MKGNAAARSSRWWCRTPSANTSRRCDTVQDSLRISEREFATGLSYVTISRVSRSGGLMIDVLPDRPRRC